MLNRSRSVLPLLVICAGLCFPQSPAVTAFTGATTFGSIGGTDQTIGWTFTPQSNVIVSSLGVWELDTSVPLTQSHAVGLWTSAGTLLASVTVPTNGTVNGSWRYASI